MMPITWTDIGYGIAATGLLAAYFVYHWSTKPRKRKPAFLLRPVASMNCRCICAFGQDEPNPHCRSCSGSGRLNLPRPSFSAPASEIPCVDCLNGYHGLYSTDCPCPCHGHRRPVNQSMGGAV